MCLRNLYRYLIVYMKQIVYHLFLCIILFLFLVKSPAQRVPLYFNLVTGSNGISIGKVGGITQDKWGYM